MTQDAQSALRRTMETYSRITRFCLICNYVTRIIDPLASRCSKFRFKSLDGGDAGTRVESIAEKEGVRLEEGVKEALIRCSEGDLRRAITYLQSAARLVGAVSGGGSGQMARGRKRKVVDEEDDEAEEGDKMDVDGDEAPKTQSKGKSGQAVTVKIVEEIAGVIPQPVIESLTAAMRGSGNQGSTYNKISTAVTDLIADGWSATQTIGQLFQAVVFDETIADTAKNRILGVFSEADKRLVDGSDEHLTVLDLCLRISGYLRAA